MTPQSFDRRGRLIKRDGAPTNASAIGLNYAYFDTGRIEAITTDLIDPDAMGLSTAAMKDLQGQLYLDRYPDVRASAFMDMQWADNPNSDGDSDVFDWAHKHYAAHGGGGAFRTNPANLVSQRRTTYAYDKAGNVVSEKYADIGLWGTSSPPPEGYFTNATAEYDALGRLTHWEEAGSLWNAPLQIYATPPAEIDYKYDAVGNIRRSTSSFRKHPPGTAESPLHAQAAA